MSTGSEQPRLVFIIAKDGSVRGEAEGVRGQACAALLDKLAALTQSLGQPEVVLKPEFHDTGEAIAVEEPQG